MLLLLVLLVPGHHLQHPGRFEFLPTSGLLPLPRYIAKLMAHANGSSLCVCGKSTRWKCAGVDRSMSESEKYAPVLRPKHGGHSSCTRYRSRKIHPIRLL